MNLRLMIAGWLVGAVVVAQIAPCIEFYEDAACNTPVMLTATLAFRACPTASNGDTTVLATCDSADATTLTVTSTESDDNSTGTYSTTTGRCSRLVSDADLYYVSTCASSGTTFSVVALSLGLLVYWSISCG